MTPADTAAQAWGGRVVRLLRDRENHVFEMSLPQGRAALRLHRAGYQAPAAIRSELWWCAELARSGLPIPSALPTQDGRLLVPLQDGRHASAISWIKGEALGEAGQPFATGIPQRPAPGFVVQQAADSPAELFVIALRRRDEAEAVAEHGDVREPVHGDRDPVGARLHVISMPATASVRVLVSSAPSSSSGAYMQSSWPARTRPARTSAHSHLSQRRYRGLSPVPPPRVRTSITGPKRNVSAPSSR